jgi:hypothetical protein
MTEGGVTCWLNQSPDLHWYWDDGSYEETIEASAAKIFYYNGDHSAIKSPTHSGMYESKWGQAPRMRHAPGYGPANYNMSYRRYYKRTPRTVSGPKLVLNNGSTYTLSGGNGGTATWTCSPNLQILSSSNTAITVKAQSATFNGLGWIQASVGGASTPRYEVWIGKPVITGITTTMEPFGNRYTFRAQCDNRALAVPTRFQWKVDPFYPFLGGGFDEIQISFNRKGIYTISVRASNLNGTGNYSSTGVSVNSSPPPSSTYRVSQDPASNELTVSPDTSVSQLSPLSPSSGAAGNNYTVYLYNTGGAVVKQAVSPQGGDVRLDVSGLPNGIYYLLIDAGNGTKPESHKIIINH